MKSVWRKHLISLSAFGLLAVPIYLLDLASSGGGGGNWITLDFRGFIFWTYVTWFVIHIALSSIAVLSFPQSGLLRIHFLWRLNGAFPDPARRRLRRLRKAAVPLFDGRTSMIFMPNMRLGSAVKK